MRNKIQLILFGIASSLGISNLTAVPDGKQVYKQMCASCHGLQGEGVGNGAFPPLKDSEWLKGEPHGSQRIAQIMLHGLTGPIEVKGKLYNLAMPIQGALSDEQKVAVIAYLKKEFAGEKTDFALKDLQALKEKHKRDKPWTAAELEKLYPLPIKPSPISNLIMTVYHGQWTEMPDFSKLKPVAEEEEHDGFISLKNINRKDLYGLVWSGDLAVPKTGEYVFELMSDDGSAVFIDGKELARVKGLGTMSKKRMKRGKVRLERGNHELKVHYFEYQGGEGIALNWRPAGSKQKQWLTAKPHSQKKQAPVMIDLTTTTGETKMYQNFIAGSTHRTMGVGYPFGHNIAFSLSDCQPDMIWQGKFISAGRHWTARGQGAQAPLSNNVVKLGSGPAWSQNGEKLKVKLSGYTMDKTGNPTFRYTAKAQGLVFSEKYLPSKEALKRVITVTAQKDQELELRLVKGQAIMTEAGAIIDDQLILDTQQIRGHGGESRTDLKIKKGTNTFTITYSWKK